MGRFEPAWNREAILPKMRAALALAVVASLAIVTSLGGCRDDSTAAAREVTALTVPVPAVTQFAVLAARSISVGDRSSVVGGDVGVAAGAGNSLTTGIDARVGVGEVVLAPVVTLRDRTNTGEVGANTLNIGPGVVTGPRSPFVSPPPAPLPGTFTVGTTAVTVNGGQTRTLAAGKYGAVTVNGTLNLSGGLYEIQSLRIGPEARVAASASSRVRVSTGVAVADRADLVGPAAQGARGLHLTVAGTIDGPTNSLSLGVDVVLTAVVVARNGFRTGDRLVARGAISAQDVFIGNDGTLTFDDGFGCGSNASCNDNNPCTIDACADALCASTSAPNGSACDDNNACTQTATCQAGSCVGGNPVVCVASDPCHVAGVCNPATGLCSSPNAPNGTACNDNDACTQTDTCQMGTCTGTNPVTCVASDQCHAAGVCDPATGVCSDPSVPNGTACNDSDACTQTDTCQMGTCTGDNPIVCVAIDQCHVPGSCNPATGACSNPSAPNGTACSDGNACTQTDTCQMGTCAGGNPVVCMASDPCHVPGSCNPLTGVCTNPNSPNGTACNDGNVCTRADTCQNGSCTGGSSIVTEYASGLPAPKQITNGPDGNLWFVSTEVTAGVGAIARIAPASGAVTTYLTNAPPRDRAVLVDDIVAGGDGNLWFTARIPALDGLPTIGSITPSGVFVTPDLDGSPGGTIGAGPDGNIWTGGSFLGVIDVVFRDAEPGVAIAVENTPRALVAGPDSNVWFVASSAGRAFVGRVVPNTPGFEELTTFPVTTTGDLNDIAAGPDGNLWFTDAGQNDIVRITPAGTMTRFPVPTAASGVFGIVRASDGNLWFTEQAGNKLGRITPSGQITELSCLAPSRRPTNIASGPDGRLWFTESATGHIGALTLP